MKFRRGFRRVHNIVGVVLGLQVLFWVVSGFFFTLFPIEQVRGTNLRAEIDHGLIDLATVQVSAAQAVSAFGDTPESISLDMFLGAPVWKLTADGRTGLVDAQTADMRSPIPEATALQIARLGLKEKAGQAGPPHLLEADAPREYAGPLPVWVVDYEPGNVRAYIDAQTGELRTVRTDLWRMFDVLWRFHIMDITGDDRFDTWWLKLISFVSLSLAISGLVLGIDRLRRGTLLH